MKAKPLLPNWKKELKNILNDERQNIVLDLRLEDFIDRLLTEQKWNLAVKYTKLSNNN